MLKTPLCLDLGIDHPIFSVGFGPSAGPKLAAAVSQAGACGCLGSGGSNATRIRELIGAVRSLTSKPFGVNVVLHINRDGVIEACCSSCSGVIPSRGSATRTAAAFAFSSRSDRSLKRAPRPMQEPTQSSRRDTRLAATCAGGLP